MAQLESKSELHCTDAAAAHAEHKQNVLGAHIPHCPELQTSTWINTSKHCNAVLNLHVYKMAFVQQYALKLVR